MPRHVLAADPGLGQRILDLQNCELLESLEPEQLYGLARYCRSREVTIEQTNRPLDGVEELLVFIVEGLFERVYFKDKAAMDTFQGAVVLNQLDVGDTWGEHLLVQSTAIQTWHLGLRARTTGRIVLIKASQFALFLEQWPQVRNRLLSQVLAREFNQALQLGSVRAQVEHTNYIIDRIESVANFLIEQSGGQDGQQMQVQKKYLLKGVPGFAGNSVKLQQIVQGYLAISEDREDRIRSIDSQQFTRTTKVGSGQTRKTYERTINEAEFNQLMKKITGRQIVKTRYKLTESAVGLAIDQFTGSGDLSGLCLLEIDFADSAQIAQFELPKWLESFVEKEVTEDRTFSNRYLALGSS